MRSRASDDDHPFEGPERRTDNAPAEVEPVVLTRKYAESIDGISLAGRDVGDRLPLSRHDARMLIAEGWAKPIPTEQRRRPSHDD